MSRRKSLEIVREILELCRTPRLKTQIVYQCNLNFKIVNKYLDMCFANGWLQKVNRRYETTSIGSNYLIILIPVMNIAQF